MTTACSRRGLLACGVVLLLGTLAEGYCGARGSALFPRQPRCVARMEELAVDLGEGAGAIAVNFQPIVDDSEFFVARFPVPFDLNVEPRDGQVVVTKSDDQLREGDIVRATSTFSMRMDTSFGLLPAAKKVKALFDLTGKEWEDVVKAFQENRKSVTNEVVLVIERPPSVA
eukprot:CAMPEP_0119407324 /NCGR_PEP_ID=MMETSP1335-20130426/1261_1 /TAXON_ID=259385 /ORGANISM="Chrysoculter rhomboideus, Strain RCC1486" /LENGTH=170 /DNA_ID=CAMNT_0007431421 /DNA_START=44 /DNA_END=553 /DNA_ORIENTATION=-